MQLKIHTKSGASYRLDTTTGLLMRTVMPAGSPIERLGEIGLVSARLCRELESLTSLPRQAARPTLYLTGLSREGERFASSRVISVQIEFEAGNEITAQIDFLAGSQVAES